MLQVHCWQCKHFQETVKGEGGECRRNPPSVSLVMMQQNSVLQQQPTAHPQPMAYWPPVQLNHWCGEFSPAITS